MEKKIRRHSSADMFGNKEENKWNLNLLSMMQPRTSQRGFSMGIGERSDFTKLPTEGPGPEAYYQERYFGSDAPAFSFRERTPYEAFDHFI